MSQNNPVDTTEYDADIMERALASAYVQVAHLSMAHALLAVGQAMITRTPQVVYPEGWYYYTAVPNHPAVNSPVGPFPTRAECVRVAFTMNNLQEIAEKLTK